MNKTYAYSRSNSNRNEIETQQDKIEQYSEVRGIEIDEHYSDIVSGTQLGECLQKLVEEIPSGSILLVTDRSRISRNTLVYQTVVNKLLNKNVNTIFINEA